MRPDWTEYFINITKVVATRSTCERRQVGALIVKDKRILSTGYNGSPKGIQHCGELPDGCIRKKLNVPSGERHEICRAVHAEANAVIQAATHGVAIDGADVYCTTFPCSMCAKMLINAGIVRIYVTEAYPDPMSKELLDEAGVEVYEVDYK